MKFNKIMIKTGSYVTRDGEKKNNWVEVGSLVTQQDGSQFITMESWFNPAGMPKQKDKDTGLEKSRILLSVFEDRKKESAHPQNHGNLPDEWN